jgi:branched-chain amino acid transport system substrate-binding protein
MEEQVKNKSIIFIIAVCLLIIVALPLVSACKGGETATKTGTLKVGIMTPTTGIAASKGVPLRDGNLDCIDYINNELGGVNGYKIEAENLDSQYDANIAVTDINKFMNDGCLFFTTSSSTEMDYVKTIANRAGFPGLVAYSSPSNYRPPAHIYGQAPDYADDWVAFANYYMKNIWKGTGKPKMALELQNNPTGAGAKIAAKAFADQLGIEIVDQEEHAGSTTSEMEAMTRIKGAKPDVIYISSIPNAAAVIVKNAKDLGIYPGVTIGMCHAAMTKTFVDLAGADIANGVYGVVSSAAWGDNVPGMVKMTEYATKNHPKDIGNTDYSAAWAQSLIIAEILKQALNNAGYAKVSKGDAAAWAVIEKSGFQKLNGYNVDGLQPEVKYTQGDNRLSKSLRIFQVKSGTMTAVTDWIDAPLVKYETYSWFIQ